MVKTPIIESVEKLSTLYDAFQSSKRILSERKVDAGRRIRVDAEDISELDVLVTYETPYLAVANSLNALRIDLGNFRKGIEETLEYAIKYIRGQFNGRSKAEIKSVGAILGLIPYRSSGQSEGEIEGDVNLGVYDFEKLINTVPSTHQWLKDFLAQDITEVNTTLADVPEGKVRPRLKVELDRVNNAIQDCYNESNVTRLKFASQNLTEGVTAIREMIFPLRSTHPELGSFLNDSEEYVKGVKSLVDFAQEKEKVSFYLSSYGIPTPSNFKDLTPKAKRKKKNFLRDFLRILTTE